jgi:hypothetical protein
MIDSLKSSSSLLTFKQVMMMQEFHLDGTWWIPDEQGRRFAGTLTFDHHLRRCELSITSGSDFEDSLMGNHDLRPKHDIMLGVASDGQRVTLIDCERKGWCRNLREDVGWHAFAPTYVLLGDYFERPEDIIFDSISVTYSGKEVNDWIRRVQFQAIVNSHDSAKVKIRESYNISLLSCKPKSLSGSEGEEQKQSHKKAAIPCIEIESLKEQKKSLEDYLKVNLIVFDFLNFVITEEVHIESIHGLRKNRKASKENKNNNNNNTSANLQEENKPDEIRIFYHYAISGMFKSPHSKSAPLFPHEAERDATETLKKISKELVYIII